MKPETETPYTPHPPPSLLLGSDLDTSPLTEVYRLSGETGPYDLPSPLVRPKTLRPDTPSPFSLDTLGETGGQGPRVVCPSCGLGSDSNPSSPTDSKDIPKTPGVECGRDEGRPHPPGIWDCSTSSPTPPATHVLRVSGRTVETRSRRHPEGSRTQ